MTSFYIITLGCKVNLYESNFIKEKLEEKNFVNAKDFKSADIVICNTCSVTNNADKKSLKEIKRVKSQNPEAYLVICGCSCENEKDKFLVFNPDLILGSNNKSMIPELIIKNYKKNIKIDASSPDASKTFDEMTLSSFTNERAFIKIQDGCNNFCSYCIIPYLRGRERSKKSSLVLREVNSLVLAGFKEIVLTGINTGSYCDEGIKLTGLVRLISKIEKLERIRISSIEPTEINEDLFDLLKTEPKLCNHLHIPLQSGSDAILKKMNRKYNLKDFENIIKKIRKTRKGISISTDVIVGYPGETKEEFEKSYKYYKKLKFSKIHVFPYSKRKGTAASKDLNTVSEIEKKYRVNKLLLLSDELTNKYNKKFINKDVEVLIEKSDKEFSYGYTENYIRVRIKGFFTINSICKVRLKAENFIKL